MLRKFKVPSGIPSLAPSGSGKGRSKYNHSIVYGFFLVKGKANHPMEDFHHAEFKRFNEVELGLFAIYDGHLSTEVPRFLQKNLFKNILAESVFKSDPIDAIRKTYDATDKLILEKSHELGVGGSTAVTAIIMNGRRLIVANVGDSRAVLCKAGEAVQLSVDHDADSEKDAIERRRGYVSIHPGDVARVDGQLAVARSFGDKNLKEHLSVEPSIHDMWLDSQHEFLILASDGLWKVMPNQEAVDMVRGLKDPESAAKLLVQTAVQKDSKDDISCIVILLK